MQGTAWSRGLGRLWKLLRMFVWEATALYGVTLFIHAWVADSSRLGVFMLAMNVAQLLVAVLCSVLCFMRYSNTNFLVVSTFLAAILG